MSDPGWRDLVDPGDVIEARRLAGLTIALLPGSGADLRSAAESLRSTVPALEAAAEAGTRLGDLLSGELWNGQAWEAFDVLVARNPIQQASRSGSDAMTEAAQHLDSLGSTHDRHQDELRWIRDRWQVLTSGDIVGDGSLGELQHLEQRAREIYDAQYAAEAEVAEAFDWLDDATTFATPPPSGWDQFTGGAGSVVGGVRDWMMEAGPLLAMAANPVALGLYVGYTGVIKRDEIIDTIEYATDDPFEFAGLWGRAMIDADTWDEDKWRWFGKLLPEIGLAALTWGSGTAAKGGLRAADAVDDAVDVARTADRATDAASGAARVVRVPDDVKDAVSDLSDAALVVGASDKAVAVGSSRRAEERDC